MFKALENFLSFSFPNPAWVKYIQESAQYTPDIAKLEQYEFQLLFCPDDVQVGHENYGLISDCSAYLCTGYTERFFNYYQRRHLSCRTPVAMEASSPRVSRFFPPALPIKGELHAIQPRVFLKLDKAKLNGVQFLRKRVSLLVPWKPVLNLPEPTVPNLDKDGIPLPLPLALMGKKGVLGAERIQIIKAWMYIGNPAYWNDLFDAGYNAFEHVNHYESRRPWLKEYYQYPRDDFKK